MTLDHKHTGSGLLDLNFTQITLKNTIFALSDP